MRKSINNTCCICSASCDGKLKIKDRDWCRPMEAESSACKDCFSHWLKCDDEYLVKKVREKLIGGKQ